MNKTTYRHKNLNQAKRHVLNVSRFGGVDLTSQKFNVSQGRAIDGENFYYKDNVLQVREGFEELYDVSPVEFIPRDFKSGLKIGAEIVENPVNFNGMWQFLAEDGERHIIAHIGYLLYEVKNFGTKEIYFELLSNDNATDIVSGKVRRLLFKFLNQKSFAVVGDHKLWFLGGNQYMVIRFKPEESPKIQPVEDNNITFVPVTTMGITYANAKVGHRALLDYPNMLTMFRRNTLISGVGKDEEALQDTPYFEYTLDAPLLTKEGDSMAIDNAETIKSLNKIHVIIRERGEI